MKERTEELTCVALVFQSPPPNLHQPCTCLWTPPPPPSLNLMIPWTPNPAFWTEPERKEAYQEEEEEDASFGQRSFEKGEPKSVSIVECFGSVGRERVGIVFGSYRRGRP